MRLLIKIIAVLILINLVPVGAGLLYHFDKGMPFFEAFIQIWICQIISLIVVIFIVFLLNVIYE